MRVRTSRTELVQVAAAFALLFASAVHADDDYGASNYRDHHKTDTRIQAAEAPRRNAAPGRSGDDARRRSHLRTASPTASAATVPHRGMSQAQVRAAYGAPASRRGPTGQPPITRWDYPEFHVYFESKRVIHSVIPDDLKALDHVSQLQTAHP